MADEPEPEIATLASRVIYRNRWMTVREDAIRRLDGSPGIYGVVEKPDFVAIVGLAEDGTVPLVEQYRYAVGARFWELPQGAWEDRPEASMAAVAAGELLEETGLRSGRLEFVGRFLLSYGFARQAGHVFLARDLTQEPIERLPEEQGMICRAFPLETVWAMVADGTIQDATSITALGLCRIKGLL